MLTFILFQCIILLVPVDSISDAPITILNCNSLVRVHAGIWTASNSSLTFWPDTYLVTSSISILLLLGCLHPRLIIFLIVSSCAGYYEP